MGRHNRTARPAMQFAWALRLMALAKTYGSVIRVKMRTKLMLLALSALFVQGGSALAQPGMDCPLAVQPYSADTIVADLLLNPKTRAVIERQAPVLVHGKPGFPSMSDIPGFGTIVNLRGVAGWAGIPDDVVSQIDREIRLIEVTPADTIARCARYDQVPPELSAITRRPALLVFGKIVGFRDVPSVNAAKAALEAMAARRGWTLVETDNAAVFNAEDLRKFDAVIWNNVSGDVLTVPQEKAFQDYIANGGGFAGFHGSGGDPFYVWDWYTDTLIGARFIGHPHAPQFQQAKVVVDDPSDAIVRGLGSEWTMTEEWYSFKSSPRSRGAHILARLDEATYNPGAKLVMGDHPIAWTQCLGNGRSFYSAIGHMPENYAEIHSVALLEAGIAWAAGEGETTCRAGQEVAK